jgi:predicted  nucleic acid-binding Zn-ribbon protein
MADPVRKRLKRDIRDLETSVADMELDLAEEKDKNSRNARSLKAQIAGERKQLTVLKKTLKDLGG